MHKTVAIPLLISFALASLASGEVRRLEITADNGICAYREEKVFNAGGRSRVRVKGNDHFYLFAFDAAGLRKWRIDRATLHLKLAAGKLRRVALCTVPVAWPEGTADNQAQRGASCYTHVKYPDVTWTPDGGTMLEATFNNPRMLWRPAEVVYDGQWMKIDLAPQLVHAVAHGLSHGLAVADETGESRENHDVYTREQSSARPYIIVEGAPAEPRQLADRPTFQAEPYEPAADFEAGAIRVVLSRPAGNPGAPGYASRVQLSRDGSPFREEVTFACPEVIVDRLPPGGKLGVTVYSYAGPDVYWSRTQEVVASGPQTAPKPPAIKPRPGLVGAQANGWRVELHDATAMVAPDAQPGRAVAAVPLPVSPRNAWVGLSAVICPPDGSARNLTVQVDGLQRAGGAAGGAKLAHVRLHRAWYVPGKSGPRAEVCVPLGAGGTLGGMDIPWKLNALPAQTNQQVFLDIWVPKDAPAGEYAGKLVVRQDGKEVVGVPIRVEVADVMLPDEISIAGSMNAYDTPARAMGASTSQPEALLAMEQEYYRLAHAHRMTLNVLPYSQSGSVHWSGAPTIAGRGAQCKVTDWSGWDRRFGPLLSGKAFDAEQGYAGPGAGVPIHHMYLPLHENWPAAMADHFRPWPPPTNYGALHLWLAGLPPIAKCFDEDYRRTWQVVLAQWQDHLRQNGWTRTRLQVYPNNKYYFRENGRGISLWLLDEPMFADDFLALAYFGGLVRAGRPGGARRGPIRYRIDISRPTHQRDWLDGVVDLNVVAGQLYTQRRQIAYRTRRFGEEYWNYSMPGSFGADNAGWASWPIRSYLWGAPGTLPWQTIGGDGDLSRAADTALMYPGRKFGLPVPLASLRMKAWRDGLQDAELLHMLRTNRKWTDVQLRAWAGQVCGLDGWPKAMDPPAESAIVTFASLGPQKLRALRLAALEALAGP